MTLNNLILRETLLDGLDLPLTVAYGSIGSIRIALNWRGLLSKPLLVTISDGALRFSFRASSRLDFLALLTRGFRA